MQLAVITSCRLPQVTGEHCLWLAALRIQLAAIRVLVEVFRDSPRAVLFFPCSVHIVL